VVEKKRAATIFKSIVDDTVRPRDPALLEWVKGSEISLKVFPIPPRGRRKVLIAYDQALDPTPAPRPSAVPPGEPAAGLPAGQVRYVYPLSFGPERAATIGDFAFDLALSDRTTAAPQPRLRGLDAPLGHEGTAATAHLDRKDFVPSDDMEVVYERPFAPVEAAVYAPAWGEVPGWEVKRGDAKIKEESYVRLLLTPPARAGAKRPPRRLVVVIDRSQGQSTATLTDRSRLAAGALPGLEEGESFALLACDSGCVAFPGEGFAAGDRREEAARWLGALKPGGSLDLAGALLAGLRRGGPGAQVVYLGDGAPSSGELLAGAIVARVAPAVESSRADLRLIGAGPAVDEATLAAVARGVGASCEPVASGEPLARRAASLDASLRAPLVRHARLSLPSNFVLPYPAELPAIALGRPLAVVARLASPEDGEVVLRGQLDGEPYEAHFPLALPTDPASQSPAVPRLWAAARVADLETSDSKAATDEVIRLSRRFHILSRHTSFLVLENDTMFEDFGIARTAPSGPGPAGSSLRQQNALLKILQTSGNSPDPVVGPLDAFTKGDQPFEGLKGASGGVGGLGSIPPGGSIGQTGTGGASVGLPRATVSGGLSSMTGKISGVDRVLAKGRARVRACYSAGLATNPDMEGKISFTLAISPGGDVSGVNLSPGGSISGSVVSCARSALSALSFDPPEGGTSATIQGAFVLKSQPAPENKPSPGIGLVPRSQPQPVAVSTPQATVTPLDEQWRSQGGETLDKLRAALEKEPRSRRAHEQLVRGLLRQGRFDFDDAYAAASRFVQLDPDLPVARELAAYAAVMEGDAAAIELVDSLAAVDPRSARAHLRAARAFEAAGDRVRSCAHWRSLGGLTPDDEVVVHETLRCRAEVDEDRPGALAAARARPHPGKLISALIAKLESSGPIDPAPSAMATQFEVKVICAAGERCPMPAVVSPTGVVFSPLTPVDNRVARDLLAFWGVQSGTYRVVLLGGSPEARGEVRVQVFGTTRVFPFPAGGSRSVASVEVTFPSQGLTRWVW
jgi:Ca-activated chloride channel family protein